MTRKLLLQKICPNACKNSCAYIGCGHCNVILNELLDEYDKYVIEQYKANTGLNDTIKDIHDNVAKEMYCKGVDDLCKAIEQECGYDADINDDCYFETSRATLLCLAKQLKAGGKNE